MTDLFVAPKRRVTREDILPLAEYLPVRRERRLQISAIKQRRRLEVGPYACFHFENFETVRHQVQEMLYIEKGGDPQLADQLEAYNPLIPQGSELSATVMFEIDEPVRRAATLARLSRIEHHALIDVGGMKVRGLPDPTRENTSSQGKASSVQFLKFACSSAQIARFKSAGAAIVVGFDHPDYAHMAVMPEPVRVALAKDFD